MKPWVNERFVVRDFKFRTRSREFLTRLRRGRILLQAFPDGKEFLG